MIAVTFALPSESSEFVRLLERESGATAGSHTISGALHGRAVCVLHTGVGETATRARIAAFLHEQTPELLISSGFAGALNDQLRVGDLLLAENYSAPRLASVAHSKLDSLRCKTGNLATAAAMIDSASQRRELAKKKGADAVDMETQFIAQACAAAEIPMLSLRAISDTRAAPFPAPPHVLFDMKKQKTDLPRLFFYLARHPATIGRFVVFGRQIVAARRSLADALALLVRDASA